MRFPSPNRTCTFQRIRLSIQPWPKAMTTLMSRRRRPNRGFGSLSAHVASLCCISLIIKGLHLIGSGSLHSKLIELSSFAM